MAVNRDERIRNEQIEQYLGEFLPLFQADTLVELLLNDDGNVWAEFNGEPMRLVGTMSPWDAAGLIALVSDSMGEVATRENPVVEGEFPLDGSRFEGVLPPVVRAPIFNIRKHAAQVISLEAYVESGAMPPAVRDIIRQAIRDRLNLLVVGGTGSGKTTLMNGIILEMGGLCPDDRLVITEDTRELQSASPNTLFLRTTTYVTKQMLLRVNMRTRPDRLLDGEVRGGEALDLLMMWNTGHPGGVATIHANSAAAGLVRLGQLVGIASATPMPELIGEAVDVLIYLERRRGLRSVRQVLRCHGYDTTTRNYRLESLYAA